MIGVDDLIELMMTIKNVKLKRYPDLVGVNAASFNFTIEEFMESEHGGFDEYGNEVDLPVQSIFEHQRMFGIWGFVHLESETIHYWVDPSTCTLELAIHFFGHELSHIYLDFNGEIEEETKAEIIGAIAIRVYHLAKRVLEL